MGRRRRCAARTSLLLGHLSRAAEPTALSTVASRRGWSLRGAVGTEDADLLAATAEAVDRRGERRIARSAFEVGEEHVVAEALAGLRKHVESLRVLGSFPAWPEN